MIEVLKRDKKTKECFQEHKIRHAIEKAYQSVGKEIDDGVLKCVFERIGIYDIDEDDEVLLKVEDIQDNIEKCLFDYDTEVAISFHDYRLTHKLIRSEKKGLAREFAAKLMCEKVENQNANVDEYSFGGRMGEASNVYKKDYALNNCVSKQTKRNHLNNESYIHDLDNYASGEHNCLTMPIDKLFRDGTKVRQTDIRPANSINTAFQLLAVYFQIQSLEQFGGISASHLDWSMVPYVRKSFFKHFTEHYICDEAQKENVDFSKLTLDEIDEYKDIKRGEFKEKYNINNEKFSMGDFSVDVVNFHLNDDKIKNINEKWYNDAVYSLKNELSQAVEGMYHNLNSLQSRSGRTDCRLAA